jgi:membrane-bound lytic murein transglycosylase D
VSFVPKIDSGANFPNNGEMKWRGILGAVTMAAALAQATPVTLWKDGIAPRRKTHAASRRAKSAKPDPIIKFDYPIQYNRQVQHWVHYFQNGGRKVFTNWLKRSKKYLPHIQRVLREEGLPEDLAYIPMIESGFVAHARSPAKAVGPWQFITETGNRYGLRTTWWLDERMDFEKSTRAAARYLRYLYSIFNSWNLVAAGYNTGENRIIRLMEKHNTRNFWLISKYGGISRETQNYVPKLIATMLIAKAPKLYGFRRATQSLPLTYDRFLAPGGTHLDFLAARSGISKDLLRDLNPELIRGYIPFHVNSHSIRIPPGTGPRIAKVLQAQLITSNDTGKTSDRN